MISYKTKIIKGIKNPAQGRQYVFSRLMGELHKLKFKLAGINFNCGKSLRTGGKLEVKGPGVVSIGDNLLFEGGTFGINSMCTYSPNARITIGSYNYLNGVRISCCERVEIGDFCIFAYSHVSDSDFHSVEPTRRDPETPVAVKPVIIEDNVWVCLSALIFKGVTVGKNSVVGGGAVVTQDVPPNCVVAGNPARIVKKFTEQEIENTKILFDKLRDLRK
ncbi:MAG: acyltransferase [Candidatus Krumholzibacteriota bacterium]|nr:acyltransferase [Candidatus Krumholzibacteriota bacterium]